MTAAKFVWMLLLPAAAGSAAPLFDTDEVLEATLSGPLGSVIEAIPEREEQSFTLRADDSDHDIEVRIRGNSRLRVCRFPQLRLDFDRDATDGTVFEGQNKLKLVTHCRTRDSSEQDVLLEYLAYRIFNELSDISYRVRLLRIDYDDTDGALDADERQRYGFVIESDEALAERTGGVPAELPGVARGGVDPQQAALVYVFQYLIGNTDWSIVTADSDDYCCHNIDLFLIDGTPYLVPYDFDLSGLVRAPYARPDPALRISRVTQRVYRGYCVDGAALAAALQAIRDREATILEMPATITGLSEREAKNARRFLARFFERAEDPERLLKSFEARCL